ncbi:hypothetical protein TNCV_2308521 [Trichonephila clavipes]|nr:hypothetical protein TNCV_2308521 [Trichonephila clavipes]
MLILDPVSKRTSTCLKLILAGGIISYHFDEVGILYNFLGFFDGGKRLEHPVAKLLVVVEVVGISDIGSAAEEKRTGDDKKVRKAEESIHCILNPVMVFGY